MLNLLVGVLRGKLVASILHSTGMGVLSVFNNVASGFQQFGELAGDTLHAEKVGMVSPFQDELFTDFSLLGQFGTTGLLGTLLEQIVRGHNAHGVQFLLINITNSLNLFDFVSHSSLNYIIYYKQHLLFSGFSASSASHRRYRLQR